LDRGARSRQGQAAYGQDGRRAQAAGVRGGISYCERGPGIDLGNGDRHFTMKVGVAAQPGAPDSEPGPTGTAGSAMVTVVPFPGALSISMRPLWAASVARAV